MPVSLKKLASNTQAETEGVWVELPIGAEVKVRRNANPAAVRLAEKLIAPHKHRLRAGAEIPRRTRDEIDREVFCREVLLDWRGIVDDDGKEVPYGVEFAMELFAKEEYKDFYSEAREASLYRETFLAEEKEESAGN